MIGKRYSEDAAGKTFRDLSEQTVKISEVFDQGNLISNVLLKVIL